MRKGVFIGIPAYAGVSAETLEDYMRFAFYIGRRCTDWDFFLGVRSKIEQFRARNSIVEAAITTGCSYLLMLDDDHVIDWEGSASPTTQYDFLSRFIHYMENDPKIGIVGTLYYQRDSYHNPVVMRLGPDGKYYWYKDEDITGNLQEVDVTGGGCFLFNMEVFNYIPSPWFEPELEFSTDIQICRKVKQHGFKIYCDTGIEVGHVQTRRLVITGKNKNEATEQVTRYSDRISDDWAFTSMMTLYNCDIEEYTGMSYQGLSDIAKQYNEKRNTITSYEKKEDYYKQFGVEQVARQWWYHNIVEYGTRVLFKATMGVLNGKNLRGLDFGCGTSPIGFEMSRIGYPMSFVDIDGAGGYEFLKWRVKKRNIEIADFTISGEYDFVLLFDIIEHLEDWKPVMENILAHLKNRGLIVTNYFLIRDRINPEHINMGQDEVKKFLIDQSIYPIDILTWRKQVG